MNKCSSICMILIKLIFVIFILLLGVNILLKPDLFKSITLDYEFNDFCESKTNINSSKNNLDYLVCDNKFKKDKFIFLLIDSLPFDSLYYFHKLNETKMTNFFRGKGIEYKQTGALFETILTGKFSRNYLASIPMKMDNIQKQFYKANYDIFYKIRDFPLYNLFNKSYIHKIVKNKGEKILLTQFCDINLKPFQSFKEKMIKDYTQESGMFFKEEITKEIFYQKANEKLGNEFKKLDEQFDICFTKREFISTIFYTDILDHIIHESHRSSPIAIFSIYFLENFIIELIKWINEKHGEFALALVSDHGGQLYFGEDTLCNHGCNSIGNEATFFIYTKELGDNYEKYKTIDNYDEIPIVSLNDFPCTFIQAIKNIN